MQIHLKGDERIPGDTDFVDEVLDPISEQMDRRYRRQGKGCTFDRLSRRVGQLFGLDAKEIVIPGNSLPVGRGGQIASDSALSVEE